MSSDNISTLENLYAEREEKLKALIDPFSEYHAVELAIRDIENSIGKEMGLGPMTGGRSRIANMSNRIPAKHSDFAFKPKTGAEKLLVTICKVSSMGLVYENGIHIGDYRRFEFDYD